VADEQIGLDIPRWDTYVKEYLNDKAILFFDGKRPDKIFQVSTFKGAKRCITIFKKVKLRNWIVFSTEGHDRAVILMATAMLLRDLEGDEPLKIYAEDPLAYVEEGIPTVSAEFNKDAWKPFLKHLKEI